MSLSLQISSTNMQLSKELEREMKKYMGKKGARVGGAAAVASADVKPRVYNYQTEPQHTNPIGRWKSNGSGGAALQHSSDEDDDDEHDLSKANRHGGAVGSHHHRAAQYDALVLAAAQRRAYTHGDNNHSPFSHSFVNNDKVQNNGSGAVSKRPASPSGMSASMSNTHNSLLGASTTRSASRLTSAATSRWGSSTKQRGGSGKKIVNTTIRAFETNVFLKGNSNGKPFESEADSQGDDDSTSSDSNSDIAFDDEADDALNRSRRLSMQQTVMSLSNPDRRSMSVVSSTAAQAAAAVATTAALQAAQRTKVSRFDLVLEEDVGRVLDAYCAVDEGLCGYLRPSAIKELCELASVKYDPGMVSKSLQIAAQQDSFLLGEGTGGGGGGSGGGKGASASVANNNSFGRRSDSVVSTMTTNTTNALQQKRSARPPVAAAAIVSDASQLNSPTTSNGDTATFRVTDAFGATKASGNSNSNAPSPEASPARSTLVVRFANSTATNNGTAAAMSNRVPFFPLMCTMFPSTASKQIAAAVKGLLAPSFFSALMPPSYADQQPQQLMQGSGGQNTSFAGGGDRDPSAVNNLSMVTESSTTPLAPPPPPWVLWLIRDCQTVTTPMEGRLIEAVARHAGVSLLSDEKNDSISAANANDDANTTSRIDSYLHLHDFDDPFDIPKVHFNALWRIMCLDEERRKKMIGWIALEEERDAEYMAMVAERRREEAEEARRREEALEAQRIKEEAAQKKLLLTSKKGGVSSPEMANSARRQQEKMTNDSEMIASKFTAQIIQRDNAANDSFNLTRNAHDSSANGDEEGGGGGRGLMTMLDNTLSLSSPPNAMAGNVFSPIALPSATVLRKDLNSNTTPRGETREGAQMRNANADVTATPVFSVRRQRPATASSTARAVSTANTEAYSTPPRNTFGNNNNTTTMNNCSVKNGTPRNAEKANAEKGMAMRASSEAEKSQQQQAKPEHNSVLYFKPTLALMPFNSTVFKREVIQHEQLTTKTVSYDNNQNNAMGVVVNGADSSFGRFFVETTEGKQTRQQQSSFRSQQPNRGGGGGGALVSRGTCCADPTVLTHRAVGKMIKRLKRRERRFGISPYSPIGATSSSSTNPLLSCAPMWALEAFQSQQRSRAMFTGEPYPPPCGLDDNGDKEDESSSSSSSDDAVGSSFYGQQRSKKKRKMNKSSSFSRSRSGNFGSSASLSHPSQANMSRLSSAIASSTANKLTFGINNPYAIVRSGPGRVPEDKLVELCTSASTAMYLRRANDREAFRQYRLKDVLKACKIPSIAITALLAIREPTFLCLRTMVLRWEAMLPTVKAAVRAAASNPTLCRIPLPTPAALGKATPNVNAKRLNSSRAVTSLGSYLGGPPSALRDGNGRDVGNENTNTGDENAMLDVASDEDSNGDAAALSTSGGDGGGREGDSATVPHQSSFRFRRGATIASSKDPHHPDSSISAMLSLNNANASFLGSRSGVSAADQQSSGYASTSAFVRSPIVVEGLIMGRLTAIVSLCRRYGAMSVMRQLWEETLTQGPYPGHNSLCLQSERGVDGEMRPPIDVSDMLFSARQLAEMFCSIPVSEKGEDSAHSSSSSDTAAGATLLGTHPSAVSRCRPLLVPCTFTPLEVATSMRSVKIKKYPAFGTVGDVEEIEVHGLDKANADGDDDDRSSGGNGENGKDFDARIQKLPTAGSAQGAAAGNRSTNTKKHLILANPLTPAQFKVYCAGRSEATAAPQPQEEENEDGSDGSSTEREGDAGSTTAQSTAARRSEWASFFMTEVSEGNPEPNKGLYEGDDDAVSHAFLSATIEAAREEDLSSTGPSSALARELLAKPAPPLAPGVYQGNFTEAERKAKKIIDLVTSRTSHNYIPHADYLKAYGMVEHFTIVEGLRKDATILTPRGASGGGNEIEAHQEVKENEIADSGPSDMGYSSKAARALQENFVDGLPLHRVLRVRPPSSSSLQRRIAAGLGNRYREDPALAQAREVRSGRMPFFRSSAEDLRPSSASIRRPTTFSDQRSTQRHSHAVCPTEAGNSPRRQPSPPRAPHPPAQDNDTRRDVSHNVKPKSHRRNQFNSQSSTALATVIAASAVVPTKVAERQFNRTNTRRGGTLKSRESELDAPRYVTARAVFNGLEPPFPKVHLIAPHLYEEDKEDERECVEGGGEDEDKELQRSDCD